MEELWKDRETLAYLAGIFDGEGCITSYGTPRKDHTTYSAPSVSVQVSNNDLEVLVFSQRRLGGKIYSKGVRKPGYKPQWSWFLRGKEAENCLLELLPYLRIKQSQARIGLRMLALQGIRNSDIYETRRTLAKQLSTEKG